MKYYLAVLMKYVGFNGRATRSEFWYFILFNTIIAYLLRKIGMALNLPSIAHRNILNVIYFFAVLPPAVCVLIRRMHDINRSGWFILIPILNILMACENGTDGTNKYGPDPKADNLSNTSN